VKITYTDPKTKQRVNLEGKADITFTASAEEAAKSVNAAVAGAVATQLATERSEHAVKLRDEGKIAEAKQALESNAAYLRQQADKLYSLSPSAASPLKDMAERNDKDAEKVGSAGEWNSQRKSMKADQYRAKTQQKY
jgi:Ca-activated chloride channel family protein